MAGKGKGLISESGSCFQRVSRLEPDKPRVEFGLGPTFIAGQRGWSLGGLGALAGEQTNKWGRCHGTGSRVPEVTVGQTGREKSVCRGGRRPS